MYKKITSSSNTLIKEILSLDNSDKVFFVFGEKIIKELLKSNYELVNLLVLDSKIDLIDIQNKIKNKIILINKDIVSKLCINRKEWIFGLFKKKSKEEIILKNKIVLLDNIQHPNNAAEIIRTSFALGIDQVIMLNGINLYNQKLISHSCGYCLTKDLIQIKDIKELKNINDYYKIVTCLDVDSKDILNINKEEINSKKTIIIFGNEGNGVSKNIIEKSDLKIKINMSNEVDSLNVAVSSVIILWELLKKIK